MVAHVYPSRAAERVLFRELFENPVTVHRNGGTIVGGAVPNKGLTLDGETQWATFDIGSDLFSRDVVSFVFEFTPDFSASEVETRYLWDSTSTDRTFLYRHSSQVLVCYVGTSYVAASLAAFGPVWQQGGRNTLVAVFDGTNATMWLNGSQIATRATSLDRITPMHLHVGASYGGGNRYVGEIHGLSIHGRAFSADDVAEIEGRSLWSFRKRANLWLDMREQTVDGGLTLTRDETHGVDALLGDGVTLSKMPEFQNPGFDLNGSSEYFEILEPGGFIGGGEQTLAIAFKPNFDTDADASIYLFDSTSNAYSILKVGNAASNTLRIYLGGVAIVFLPEATYRPAWRNGGLNVLVVSGKSADTDAYLNGVKILSADSSAWSPSVPAHAYLGTNFGMSYYYNGMIKHFASFPEKLSPLQVRDLTIALGVNL